MYEIDTDKRVWKITFLFRKSPHSNKQQMLKKKEKDATSQTQNTNTKLKTKQEKPSAP